MQREARCGKNGRELLARALPAACIDEHVEVRELGLGPFVGRRQYALDDQEPGAGMHGRTATSQDALGAFIIPIMKDALQHIGIGTGGHALEEAARKNFAAVARAYLVEDVAGACDDMHQVQESACGVRATRENTSNQCAIATADIDDVAELCKIVRAKHLLRDALGRLTHGEIEQCGVLGIGGAKGPHVLAVHTLKAGLAGATWIACVD